MADDFDPNIPRPFSVSGLAEHWGCSPSMVRKLIDQGKLGHFRLGILIRIPQSAVEEFERENTVGGVPPKAIEPTAPAAEEKTSALAPTPVGPRRIGRAPRRRPPFKRLGHDD